MKVVATTSAALSQYGAPATLIDAAYKSVAPMRSGGHELAFQA